MTEKTRTIECLSLALQAFCLIAVFSLITAWLPIMFTLAGRWKHPVPPTRVELELFHCQQIWLEYPIPAVMLLSALLRVAWLHKGRNYAIARALGRTIFDHTVTGFMVLCLANQLGILSAARVLTTNANHQCEILPEPVLQLRTQIRTVPAFANATRAKLRSSAVAAGIDSRS